MRKNDKKSQTLQAADFGQFAQCGKRIQVPASNTPEKRIVITEISTATKEDELALKIAFKLIPSKTAFSKVQLDLFFNNQQINSKTIRIIQGSLAKDDFELTPTLNMQDIPAGRYVLKVEMYELCPSGEKLSEAKKEAIVDYCPSNPRIQICQSSNQ